MTQEIRRFSTFARDFLPVLRERLWCLLSFRVVVSQGIKQTGLGADRLLSSSADFRMRGDVTTLPNMPSLFDD
jgi:hypothetical protein